MSGTTVGIVLVHTYSLIHLCSRRVEPQGAFCGIGVRQLMTADTLGQNHLFRGCFGHSSGKLCLGDPLSCGTRLARHAQYYVRLCWLAAADLERSRRATLIITTHTINHVFPWMKLG